MIDSKICPKCGAKWLGGQHYWSGGHTGNEVDLAGLVCNTHGDDTCINPQKGAVGGQTWEERAKMLEGMENEIRRMIDGLDEPPLAGV